jgi:hypothetical protein
LHSPGGNLLKPYRAIFHVNDSTVKSLGFDTDDPTGIEARTQDEVQSTMYDLSGRRVGTHPLAPENGAGQPGLYVGQGRKILVR